MPLPKKQPDNRKARKLAARKEQREAERQKNLPYSQTERYHRQYARDYFDNEQREHLRKFQEETRLYESKHLHGGSVLKGDEIPGVTGLDLIACDRWEELLPPYESLTKEDRDWNDPFHHAVSSLFYKGGSLKQYNIVPKDPNNLGKIMAYIRATLGDFGPKHEHKIGGITHMLRKWCNHEK